MLRSLVASALIFCSAPLLFMQPASANKGNFRVYNYSRENVVGLYITASGFNSWGRNILQRSLHGGTSIGITFNDPYADKCYYDFRVVLADGEVVRKYGIDVCQNEYFEVYDR